MYDNKRRLIGVLIIAALLFSFFTVYIYAKPSPSARAAALYEPETGAFLYEKNIDEHLPMASTTKIVTALLSLELLDHDMIIAIPREAVGIEGSSVYLEEGELISVKDLVYATMLASANDAAAALAIEIAGSVDGFASIMNQRAASLGLCDTNFINPHGLDANEHYTSAHDLAIIAAEALKNETFKEISSTYKHNIESSLRTRTIVNHNKLLRRFQGCIGVKTGYTHKSGRSLVSAAERDGLRLIAVTIDAPDDWCDHESMLEYGYSLLRADMLAAPGEYRYTLPVLGGTADQITVSNDGSFKEIVHRDLERATTNIRLSRYLVAPVTKGEVVGKIIFKRDGVILAELPIIAQETVNIKEKKGFFFR